MKTTVQALNESRKAKAISSLDSLNPTQLEWLALYTDKSNPDTYHNAFQCYRVIRPKVTILSAYEGGSRMLRSPKIRAFLDALGASKEAIRDNLMYAVDLAKDTKDPNLIVNSNMALAKFQNYLVDKTEVKHVDEGQKSRIDSLIDTELSRNN